MVCSVKCLTRFWSPKCSGYFPFFHLTFLPLNADKTYLLHFCDLQQAPCSAALKDMVALWPPRKSTNTTCELPAAAGNEGEDRVIMAKISINTVRRLPSLPMGQEQRKMKDGRLIVKCWFAKSVLSMAESFSWSLNIVYFPKSKLSRAVVLMGWQQWASLSEVGFKLTAGTCAQKYCGV